MAFLVVEGMFNSFGEGGKMRAARSVVVSVVTFVAGIPLGLLTGCGLSSDVPAGPTRLTAASKAAVEQEVHQFCAAVARDVTQQGPPAWEKYLADDPAFFLADQGKLVFPSRQAATQGIHEFAHTIQHIQLNWGDDLRVDPLAPEFAVVASSWHEVWSDNEGRQTTEGGFFTGLAERRKGQWQFRNAHWSVVPSPNGAK